MMRGGFVLTKEKQHYKVGGHHFSKEEGCVFMQRVYTFGNNLQQGDNSVDDCHPHH